MKKLKTILCLTLVMILALPMFAGCSLSDLFGGNKDNENDKNTDVVLTNGYYEIKTASMDGELWNFDSNKSVKIEDGVLIDWNNQVATYEIKGKNITVTWSTQNAQTLTGTVTSTSINLNSAFDGHNYVIQLKYVADVILQNGDYRITQYSINGSTLDSAIGTIINVNNGVISITVDTANNTTQYLPYTIKGKWITINMGDGVGTGIVTETSVSVSGTMLGKEFILAFEKV